MIWGKAFWIFSCVGGRWFFIWVWHDAGKKCAIYGNGGAVNSAETPGQFEFVRRLCLAVAVLALAAYVFSVFLY
jgi:hypothetical protein